MFETTLFLANIPAIFMVGYASLALILWALHLDI